MDYLEKGKTIIGEFYVTLFEKLNDQIMKKQPHLKKKKFLFHQNNAPAHSSIKAMVILDFFGYELLPHSPHFPDLDLSDY